jgi:hypothetical protein
MSDKKYSVITRRDSFDFDRELINTRVVVKLSSGEVVEGLLLDATRYWIKLKTSTTVYINKAHIVSITPVTGS